jgi:cytochrome d ubiquinol oxidase subunit II
MMASAAFGIYPNVLPAVTDPERALTIANAAAPDHGLRIGIAWWTVGMSLAVAYTIFVHRRFAGKVTAESEGY